MPNYEKWKSDLIIFLSRRKERILVLLAENAKIKMRDRLLEKDYTDLDDAFFKSLENENTCWYDSIMKLKVEMPTRADYAVKKCKTVNDNDNECKKEKGIIIYEEERPEFSKLLKQRLAQLNSDKISVIFDNAIRLVREANVSNSDGKNSLYNKIINLVDERFMCWFEMNDDVLNNLIVEIEKMMFKGGRSPKASKRTIKNQSKCAKTPRKTTRMAKK